MINMVNYEKKKNSFCHWSYYIIWYRFF